MCIIAVSEAPYSGGRELAKSLAEDFGLPYVDTSILIERAAAWGGVQKKMRAAIETAPAFLDRFTRNRKTELLLLQAALAEEIRDGNAVCYGLAANLLSLEARQILRIRVEASHRFRRLAIEERLKLRGAEAERYIRDCDQQQRRWQTYLFGSQTGLPLGYDLLINPEQCGTDAACATVAAMIENDVRFKPSNGDGASLESFAISTRIKAALAQNPETAHLDINVEVNGDTAVMHGVVRGAHEIAALQQAVSSLPIDTKVDSSQVQLGIWDYEGGFFPNVLPKSRPQKSRLSRLPAFSRPAWALAGVSGIIVLAILIYVGFSIRPGWSPLLHSQRFVGVITDSECGFRHAQQPTADCIRSCVRLKGAKYALDDGSHVLVINDQLEAAQFAAQQVVVTGAVDKSTGDLQLYSIRGVAR